MFYEYVFILFKALIYAVFEMYNGLNRIVVNPQILAGKPVIKGTRIPVYLILDLIKAGKARAEILEQYPQLVEADIVAAIDYASSILKNESVVALKVS